MSTTTVDEQQRQAIEQHYGPLGPHSVELTDPVNVTMDDGVELKGTLASRQGPARYRPCSCARPTIPPISRPKRPPSTWVK
jgi:hypothetical protein